MKKKLVSLLLAFVMALSTAPLSFAEDAKTVAGLENFTKTTKKNKNEIFFFVFYIKM